MVVAVQRAVRGRGVAIVLLLTLSGCGGGAGAGTTATGTAATGDRRPDTDARDDAGAVAAGHWEQLAASPAGPGAGPLLVWDGRELLQLGGVSGPVRRAAGSTADGPARPDVAAFSPVSGRWTRLDPAPFPVASGPGTTATWTGTQVIVLSPQGGASFTPSSGRWHRIAPPPVTALTSPEAVWSGGRLVLAVTLRPPDRQPRTEVAGYDPAADRWTRRDPPRVTGHDRRGGPLVDTPDGAVLFSLWSHDSRAGGVEGGVDVQRLAPDGRWTTLDAGWPQHETVGGPLLTDVGVVVPAGQLWCGDCSHPAPSNEHGYLADPHTLRGRAMTRGPLDDTDPRELWTGRALIALSQAEITGPGLSIVPGDVAAWDPVADRWARATRSPTALDYRTLPVWGAHRLFAIDARGRTVTLVPAAPAASPG